jgi:hypothetical protein
MAFVMLVQLSGTRDGLDWPAPGEPVPADAGRDEVAALVHSGLAAPESAAAPAAEVSPFEAPELAVAPPPSRRRRTAESR